MDDFSDVKGRQVAIRDNGVLSEPSDGPPSLFSALQASQSASTALIRRLKESKSEVAELKKRLEAAEFRASESRRLLEATIRKHATLRDVKRYGESEQAESSADRQESKDAPKSTELSFWYFVRFIRSVGRGLPSLVVPSLQSSFPAVPRLLATHLGAAVLVCACAVVTVILVSMQSSLLPTPTESADAAGMAVNPWTDSCLTGGASAWSRTDFWQGTSKAICSQCKMPLGNIVASAKASVSASAVVLAAASTKPDETIAQTRSNYTELEQEAGKALALDTIPSPESPGSVVTAASPAVPSYVAVLQDTLDDCQHGTGTYGSCKGLLPAVGHEGRIAYLRHLLIIARVAASGSMQSLDWDAASDPAGGMLYDPRSTRSSVGSIGQGIAPGGVPGAAAGSVWLLSGRTSGSTSSSASVGSSRQSESASTTSRNSHSRYHDKEAQPPSSVFYPSMPIASLGLGSHFPRHVGPSATWIHSASTLSASDAAAAVGRQSTSSLAAGIHGNDLQATIEFYSFVVAPVVIFAVVMASIVSVGIGGMLRAAWASHFVVPAVTAAITCLALLLSLDWYYSGDLASLSPILGSIVRVPVTEGGSDASIWPASADASLNRLNLTGIEVESALKTTPALAVGMEWGLPRDEPAGTLRQAPLSIELHGQAFAAYAVYFLVPLRVYQCPLLLAGIVGVSMVLAGLTQLYAGLRMNAVGRRPGNGSRLSMAAAQDAIWGCFSVLSVAMQMIIGAIKSAGGTLCLFLLGALLAISVDHSGMPSDALVAGARTGYQEWQQSPLRLLAHFNVLSALSASMHHVARMSDPGIARKYSRECSEDALRSSLARMGHTMERNETDAASGIFAHLDAGNGIVRCVNAGSWEESSPAVQGLQGGETVSAEPSEYAANPGDPSGGSPVFAALTAPFRVVLRLFVGDQAYATEPTFPRVVHTLGDWVGSQGGGYFSIGECSRIVGDLVLDASQVADSMQAGGSRYVGSGSVRSVGSADRIDMRFCGLRHAVAVREEASGGISTVVALQDTTWWGLLQPTIASVLLIWVPLIAHLTPTPRGFIHTLLSIPKVKDRLHVEYDDQLDRHGDASIVVLDVCGLKVRGKAIRMALSTYGLYLGLCYMCCLVDGLGVHGWPSDFSRLLLGLGWSPVVWVAAGTLTRVADGLILSAFDEEEA